jgi:hypothetical protein
MSAQIIDLNGRRTPCAVAHANDRQASEHPVLYDPRPLFFGAGLPAPVRTVLDWDEDIRAGRPAILTIPAGPRARAVTFPEAALLPLGACQPFALRRPGRFPILTAALLDCARAGADIIAAAPVALAEARDAARRHAEENPRMAPKPGRINSNRRPRAHPAARWIIVANIVIWAAAAGAAWAYLLSGKR